MAEWMKGDDGELYPVTSEDEIVMGHLIGTYHAEMAEMQAPEIKVRSENALLKAPSTTLQTITEIDPYDKRLVLDDPRINTHVSAFMTRMINFSESLSDKIAVGLGIFLLSLIISAAIADDITGGINGENIIPINMFPAIIFGGIVITLIYGLTTEVFKFIGREQYGINRHDLFYTFHMATNSIVPVKITGIYKAKQDFMSTSFLWNINGKSIVIKGHNLFLTEQETQRVMDFITASNDYELSKYYPEWKEDKIFVEWYQDKLKFQSDSPSAYGFGHDHTTNIILARKLYINGIKFKGSNNAMDLLKEYLEDWKNIKKNKKRDQEFIQEINKYKQNNGFNTNFPISLKKMSQMTN